MAYKLNILEDSNIIVATLYGDVDMTVDKKAIAVDVDKIISKAGNTPHWRIFDYTQYHLTFSDMTFGLAFESSNAPGNSADPRVLPVFVGTDDLIRQKSEASQQAQYGALNIPVFDTAAEAIDHCRAAIPLPRD